MGFCQFKNKQTKPFEKRIQLKLQYPLFLSFFGYITNLTRICICIYIDLLKAIFIGSNKDSHYTLKLF